MAQPRILTFNFHEPYLCLMAKTGLEMDVGHYNEGMMARQWRHDFREAPANLHLLDEKEWRPRLLANRYDVVIAHNEMNALDVARFKVPKLLVCHNRRSFLETTASHDAGDPVALYGQLLERLKEQFGFIFISESKRADYRMDGQVILPGIDLDDWGGYTGEIPSIIRVGNTLRARNLMFDVDLQEAATAGLCNRVVGENPDIPDAAPAPTVQALQEIYQTHRCMLHVTREAFEDGYNLAMLEAMATGMPVVALANATSPLRDGVDGLVGHTAEALHERLRALLDDPALAKKLGDAGRARVHECFPIARFAEAWREAIFDAAEGTTRSSVGTKAKRKHVVLNYLASPFTTGRYIEEALRDEADVVTSGFRLPEEILQNWGFEGAPPPYPAHEIDLPFRAHCSTLFDQLPETFRPECFFYIDSGDKEPMPGIESVAIPKFAYFIDTHVQLAPRLKMALDFDVVFVAQKAQLPAFQERGAGEAHWLPLAASARLHQVQAPERDIDVAYVGSLNPGEGMRRVELLGKVAKAFPNHVIGKQWPAEMAETYARAKIVVNAAYNNDLNMRVFEGLASGALLITDMAEGLEDLFEDGKHLVIYRDDEELCGLIQYYLEHPEERMAIAKAGQAEVLAKHTYHHRIATVLDVLGRLASHTPSEAAPKARAYYECPRQELIPHIPLHARKILDVGCGAGALGHHLKTEYQVEEVVGLEIVPAAADEARKVLDKVLLGSIEEMSLPFEDGYFDCIICADVLEHLVDPAAALQKLKRVLAPAGSIVISIPNIQYHEILGMLSTGAWTYMDAGLMDSTHLRFFTKSTVARMIEAADLEVGRLMPLNIRPESYVPLDESGGLQMGKVHVANLSPEAYEAFRVYQWAAVACQPEVDRLAFAREAWADGRYEAAYLLAKNAAGVNEAERHHLMARGLAKMGRMNEAEATFRQSLALHDDPEVAGDYGILLLAMNRAAEARVNLERGLAASSNHDRFRGARGLAAMIDGDYIAAFDDLSFALHASFEHRSLLKHLVEVAQTLNRLEEAEEIVRKFAEFYPGDATVCCTYIDLLLQCGKRKEARAALQEAMLFSQADEGLAARMYALDEAGEAE